MATTAEYEDRLDRALLRLHHDRLPRLADAGLVEYDGEANVVSQRASPAPAVECHDATILDHLESRLGGDDGAGGVIEGRESMLRYGRQLADEAEEELFCTHVSTDLLEDECVRRARDAVDRGVHLCAGSQNPDVRELA